MLRRKIQACLEDLAEWQAKRDGTAVTKVTDELLNQVCSGASVWVAQRALCLCVIRMYAVLLACFHSLPLHSPA